jgi:hypothetical protein
MTTSNITNVDVISSDKVEGTSVYNNAGEKLGSIDDLMIDKRSGQVRYAVLEFGMIRPKTAIWHRLIKRDLRGPRNTTVNGLRFMIGTMEIK